MKKNNERDKMLEYIEQEEKGGKSISTRSLYPAQDQQMQQDTDPRITHEIQQKKLYVEKLHAELKRLKEENEAL